MRYVVDFAGAGSRDSPLGKGVMMGNRHFRPEKFFKHGHRAGAPFFEKGGIKFAILDLLKDRPRHGYDIILEMERRSGGFYSPSPGAVYPTLQALEDQELVTHTVEEGKKIYALTQAGLAYLEEHQERLARHRDHWAGHWGQWDVEGGASWKKAGSPEDLRELVLALAQAVRSSAGDQEKLKKMRQVLEEAVERIEAIAEG